MSIERRQGGIFVGRQREMAELRDALDDAIEGHGQLAVLSGEPGIGKTRTAQELSSQAAAQGATVLWGWCYEQGGAPPYWPWIQPLRSYIQEKDAEELHSQMGPGASDIAQILPEVQERLPGLQMFPALDPDPARFRLFDSITNFLKNAAQHQPIMLVLDDLHWADNSSIMLLEFFSRQISNSKMMLLGTYRDIEVGRRHPLSQTLGALVREPNFRRVQLSAFSNQDAGQLVEHSAGVTLAGPNLDLILRRAEGNPLFLSELVRLIGEENIGTADSWTSTLPEGVKDIIGRRLDRLSVQCNDTLVVASAIGREFSLEQLRPLADGMAEDALLEVLEEALKSSVIEESPGSGDRYQFTHALIQETVISELTTARRVRLHLRIGEVLETLYGSGAESHATELAYHFTQAESAGGKERLVRYSLLAGQQALAAYGHEEALAFFQQALAAKEWPPVDGEAAELLHGIGRALAVTLPRNQVHEAVGKLKLAFDYYVAVGDLGQVVAIAECPIPNMSGNRTGMIELLSRALELVTHDSHEEGRLLALYGMSVGNQQGGDYGASTEAFDRALAIARREQDVSLELRTMAAASYLDWFHLRPNSCIDKSQRVLEIGQQIDDPSVLTLAHYGSVYSLCEIGNISEARQHAAACLEAGEKFQDRFWLPGALLRNVIVCMLEGDWPAAREFSDRALAMAGMDPRNLGTRVILEYGVGDSIQGKEFLYRLLEARRLISPVEESGAGNGYSAVGISVAARTSPDLDGVVDAQLAARTILSSDIATPIFRQMANTGLGILAVIASDSIEAQEQYSALISAQGTLISPACMSADRMLGLLAHIMGNSESAVGHFEDALEFCRNAGYRPELAWSSHDYGETLLERLGPGDLAKAVQLLDEALDISTELGMPPLIARVSALQEKAASLPERAPSYPDGLTQREVEVLRLIAAGKTDREIAEELFIGVRTVSTHVGNILNKTNAANRTEAASYANQQGLV